MKNKIKSNVMDFLIITALIFVLIPALRNLKYSYIISGSSFVLVGLIGFLTKNNIKLKLRSVIWSIIGICLYIPPFHNSDYCQYIAGVGFLLMAVTLKDIKQNNKNTCK